MSKEPLFKTSCATDNSAKGSDILGIRQPFFRDFDSCRNTLRVSSGLLKSFGSVYVGAEPDLQIPILNHLTLSGVTPGNSLHLFVFWRIPSLSLVPGDIIKVD